jgi:hypothetical protein
MPPAFPVFSKPIYNMRGMGIGSRVLRTAEGIQQHQRPGHMWMPLLEGEHVSTDAAVVERRGALVAPRHRQPLGGGMFDYWTIHAERAAGDRGATAALARPPPRRLHRHGQLRDHRWPHHRGAPALRRPVARPLRRPAGCAPSSALLGRTLVTSTTATAATATASCCSAATGLSTATRRPTWCGSARALPEVTSVQITFHEDRRRRHAMPPGGFRLAIVNCWDLDVGRRARETPGAQLLVDPAAERAARAARKVAGVSAGDR